jgi:hypothetical protein
MTEGPLALYAAVEPLRLLTQFFHWNIFLLHVLRTDINQIFAFSQTRRKREEGMAELDSFCEF